MKQETRVQRAAGNAAGSAVRVGTRTAATPAARETVAAHESAAPKRTRVASRGRR